MEPVRGKNYILFLVLCSVRKKLKLVLTVQLVIIYVRFVMKYLSDCKDGITALYNKWCTVPRYLHIAGFQRSGEVKNSVTGL